MKRKKIKVYPRGGSIIVDFGEMVVDFLTRYPGPITKVHWGGKGIISFRADGVRGFISLDDAVFGHKLSNIPSEYKILADPTGLGKAWLYKRIRELRKTPGKTDRTPRRRD